MSARPRTVAGVILSAAMLALYSRVEAPWYALGFVALVPFLDALDRATSARAAAAVGALMSAAFVVAVFPWFPVAAQRYTQGSAAPLWILMVAAAPLLEPQFLVFALVRRAARGSRASAALAAACAYVAVELLVPKLFFDTLGLGLHPARALRNAADLAGAHGLTWGLILVNEAALFAAVEPRRRARTLALAAAGVLAVAGYGAARAAQIEAQMRRPAHVAGVVQANITGYDKMRAEKGAFETVRTILDAHVALSDEIRARAAPDVIVWPETVYPTTFGAPRSEAGAAFDAEIAGFAARRGVPLIFGAFEDEGDREFNAAFFLPAQPGDPPAYATYRKRMLFPFTEWVPPALDGEALRRALPWAGHWTRGPGAKVVPLALRGGETISVAPFICYDVLFPDLVGDAVKLGADWIVTLSNDAWFPDARAPRLHLVSAAFRSVEARLPQVRATNSGISAVIAPTGDIVAQTAWDQRQTLAVEVPSAGRRITAAVALGPLRGPIAAAAAILMLIYTRRRDLKRAGAPRRTEG